jgi:predicted nuclease of predicted toxin-antitoxin system
MKSKFDEDLDGGLAAPLLTAGRDVTTVREQRLSGRPDESIYAACRAERRILITLDLDFSNPLRFPVARVPGIIVLRLPRPLLRIISSMVAQLPALLQRERPEGSLWILQPERLRIFTPEAP